MGNCRCCHKKIAPNCTNCCARCAMLGRVIMACGHRALHCVQHTLYYLPEPFGVALRAPVSVRHQWASPQHSSSELGSAFGLHHWLVASTAWLLRGKKQPGGFSAAPSGACGVGVPPCRGSAGAPPLPMNSSPLAGLQVTLHLVEADGAGAR